VKVWDTVRGAELATASHAARVLSAALSPDGRWLATAGVVDLKDNPGRDPAELVLWDVNSNRRLRRLPITAFLVGGMAFRPDGRIEMAATAATVPQIDRTYIPPVLACDAWESLGVGVLEMVFDQIGKKSDLLAGQIASQGIGMECPSPGDRAVVEQLRVF
jgi:hypothetical protein